VWAAAPASELASAVVLEQVLVPESAVVSEQVLVQEWDSEWAAVSEMAPV
jgi:hypothetical protein